MKNTQKSITEFKGKPRQEFIKNICYEYVRLLTRQNKKTFTREELLSYVGANKTSYKTRCKVFKELITNLLKKGLVRESREIKKAVYYKRALLTSKDYGSFKLLMEKNGFRKNKPLKTDNTEKTDDYIKEVIGFSDDDLEDDKVFLWSNSFKPYSQQGVFSRGSKSIIRVVEPYEIKVYELI